MDYAAEHKFAVEALGIRRARLLEALAEVEAELHCEMRALREAGATQVEIMAASGYRSIDGVRKILDPAVRDGAAAARKSRRRLDDGRAAVGRVILTEDGRESSITGSGWAQGG